MFTPHHWVLTPFPTPSKTSSNVAHVVDVVVDPDVVALRVGPSKWTATDVEALRVGRGGVLAAMRRRLVCVGGVLGLIHADLAALLLVEVSPMPVPRSVARARSSAASATRNSERRSPSASVLH